MFPGAGQWEEAWCQGLMPGGTEEASGVFPQQQGPSKVSAECPIPAALRGVLGKERMLEAIPPGVIGLSGRKGGSLGGPPPVG